MRHPIASQYLYRDAKSTRRYIIGPILIQVIGTVLSVVALAIFLSFGNSLDGSITLTVAGIVFFVFAAVFLLHRKDLELIHSGKFPINRVKSLSYRIGNAISDLIYIKQDAEEMLKVNTLLMEKATDESITSILPVLEEINDTLVNVRENATLSLRECKELDSEVDHIGKRLEDIDRDDLLNEIEKRFSALYISIDSMKQNETFLYQRQRKSASSVGF